MNSIIESRIKELEIESQTQGYYGLNCFVEAVELKNKEFLDWLLMITKRCTTTTKDVFQKIEEIQAELSKEYP